MNFRHIARTLPVLAMAGMLAGSLLAGGLLSGCGGGKGGDSKKPAGPVTLTIWEQMDPKEVDRFDRHLNDYMAAHPNVKIEHSHFSTEDLRSQYQNAANAGGGPDLVYGPSDQVGPFSVLKIILPIETLVPADTLARFHPAAFDTLDGHVWALPDQIGNHLILVYNKDLVPTPPATFEELIELAKKNTVDDNGDGTPDRYGLVFETNEPFWTVPFLTGFGGWVMDAAGAAAPAAGVSSFLPQAARVATAAAISVRRAKVMMSPLDVNDYFEYLREWLPDLKCRAWRGRARQAAYFIAWKGYTAKSICCTLPAWPSSFRNTPLLRTSPLLLLLASLSLKSLWIAPRKMAPIFRWLRSISESWPAASLNQIFSFLKIASA